MAKAAVKKKNNKQVIRLSRSAWTINLNAPLGSPGGFGEVFHGTGEDGREVAIKRLKLTAADAAHREMRIGEFLLDRSHKHIVPVLDVGQDADSDGYYLVMPVCERSLQQEIEKKKNLSPEESIKILLDVLSGLEEAKELTHRDIKPSNILLHDGVWKIADFGIAKFVEESTSLKTLKDSLTPPYAAPEQWELRTSTTATDIYAVACMAHTLASGTPPFSGTTEQLKDRHLSSAPPPLKVYPDSVQGLISQMLRKSQETRPTRKRCVDVLTAALSPVENKSHPSLVSAVAIASENQAKREAEAAKIKTLQDNQKRIFEDALAEIKKVKMGLFGAIRAAAAGALQNRNSLAEIAMERAVLSFNVETGTRRGIQDCKGKGARSSVWSCYDQGSAWDFIALGQIFLSDASTGRPLRSANLIFGRPNDKPDIRWWELAFFAPFGAFQNGPAPFAEDHLWEIDQALSSMHTIQSAYSNGPVPIDGEDAASFIQYWVDLFAQAAIGRLHPIRSLPIER